MCACVGGWVVAWALAWPLAWPLVWPLVLPLAQELEGALEIQQVPMTGSDRFAKALRGGDRFWYGEMPQSPDEPLHQGKADRHPWPMHIALNYLFRHLCKIAYAETQDCRSRVQPSTPHEVQQSRKIRRKLHGRAVGL